MKKKVVLVLLIVAIAVMAFAGCTYRVYEKYVSSVDAIVEAMPNMVVPNLSVIDEFKDTKFYVPDKNKVTISPEDKENMIELLYIPPVEKDSQKGADDFQFGAVGKDDPNPYRYSITMTLKNPDDLKGTITVYVQGTDYAKVKDVADMKEAGKKAQTLQGRLDELKSLYKKNVVEDNSMVVEDLFVKFQEKERNQTIRYFRVGDDFSYEITAAIVVGEKAPEGTYDDLMNKANAVVDKILVDMLSRA